MAEEIKADETLDVRGEICPNPDVKTMVKLKKMDKGNTRGSGRLPALSRTYPR